MANPLGVVGHKKATPSADDLLSIKLLCEIDDTFNPLKEESVLFLKSALKMLQASPFLRNKFGGDGVQQATVLGELLKQRSDTLNFQLHIDDMSRQLLARELNKYNMTGMGPVQLGMWDKDGVQYKDQPNLIGVDRNTERIMNLNAWGEAKGDGGGNNMGFGQLSGSGQRRNRSRPASSLSEHNNNNDMDDE